MSDKVIAVASPADNYVYLTTTAKGRLLEKKILPMNQSFIHPGDHKTKIFVDEKMAMSLVDNFQKGYCEVVQVPIVNKDNQHTEDPRDNAGVVQGLRYDKNGVYATIEARKHSEDFGSTILGASAFLHLNYIDTATGNRVGPTLLHVAATNRPHINGLGGYEEILKASADNLVEEQIYFMEEEPPEPVDELPVEETPKPEENQQSSEGTEDMTRDELIAALKALPADEALDVTAVQADADAAKTQVAELTAQLDDAKNKLSLSGEQFTGIEELADSYVELSNVSKQLADKVEALELSNNTYVQKEAEHEVDSLIEEGRLLPAQRKTFVKLALNDREAFLEGVPAESILKLSGEQGYSTTQEPDKANFAADIDRYKGMIASKAN